MGKGTSKDSKKATQSKVEENTGKKDKTIDDYLLGKMLGEGTFADVSLASAKDGSEDVAIKRMFNADDFEAVKNEIVCMTACTHENAVKLIGSGVGVKHDTGKISYLILELAKQGELFQILSLTGAFEADIHRTFAKQLYDAVDYFHKNKITHRDLKPENILLHNCVLKIADFGLATEFVEDKDLVDLVGSPGYIAPEVYAGKYGKENDIWAVNVIHFIMATGCPPFRRAESDCWWFNKLEKKKWDRWWSAHYKNSQVELSDDLKNLFETVFEVDREKRPTIEQILNHKFFKGECCPQNELMTRFNDKTGNYTDYTEEDFSEGMTGKTNRAVGGEVDDDNPPPLPGFVLPRAKSGDTNTGGGLGGMDDTNRGENDDDEGDQKHPEAIEYVEVTKSYTHFISKDTPKNLFDILKEVVKSFSGTKMAADDKIPYCLKCEAAGEDDIIYTGGKDNTTRNKVKYRAQVYKMAKTGHSILELTRLSGQTRGYMSAWAKIREQMSDCVLVEKK